MGITRRHALVTMAGAGITLAGCAHTAATKDTPMDNTSPTSEAIPVPEPRVAHFERFGYGMFIHWGLYSQLGRGEWAMHMEKIPAGEYSKLQNTFTASDFDGRAIAKTARKAGMKYITLTSRHHDGFSLYDTRGLSDYDAPHSPAKRDLILDFVEGCRAEGIVPFLYHTTLDWYQPSFNNDFNAYLDYLHASVEVLCTQYGEIGGLWFDGNWSKKDADWKEDRLYGIIRKHQPEAIIVNNTGLHKRGALGHPEIDGVTFEQGRPTPMDRRGMSKYVVAEMCQTMNRHWGIGANDFAYMSPKEIIGNLCACRKVGANYLLNVGPTAEGAIPDYEKAALERSGDWVRMHDEVIYDGRPCAITGQGHDFCLRTDTADYLFVHDLGAQGDSNVTLEVSGPGVRKFDGVDKQAATITWMDNNEALKFKQPAAGTLEVKCTGFPYGTNTVVRVAKVTYA